MNHTILNLGQECKSNANYDEGNEVIYDTEVVISNLCDYSDA